MGETISPIDCAFAVEKAEDVVLFFCSTGTSFATGLPRLVMTTDSRLDATSSMIEGSGL